ncbi:MAG: S1C family serine protease [Inhella sp.]|jgi:S1-C subfamily serine protease|uniref:S1C family serine protease n=1 Tax=Inhella sp. TaxID=1921806 RepID=UPI0022CCD707|nr:trypsin-like peptidase domain-containing protein [Inhella sp.]MCZ8235956.1 trypsin-like peptidase domain-containing protein [Inhella sp.]
MLRRWWLIFAQGCTLALAALFVVQTLRPEWLLRPAPPRATEATIPPPPAVALPPAKGLAAAAERAAPAVVLVRTAAPVNASLLPRWHPTPPEGRQGLGSGVIVDAEGHILTNHHVVAGAERIDVQLADGREATGTVMGSDPETDLALLHIALDKLPVATAGSTKTLRVGDPVLAIGNPFGVGQTVTSGIVSALGRSQLGINVFENFIQTDAAINPGNSGGALVDAEGRWVGVNSAIYSRSGGNQGIGFAIPVELALEVAQALKSEGRVLRGWIGVQSRSISPELAEALKLPEGQKGVLVSAVVADAPAAKAGMVPGDVLVAVAGHAVSSPEELLQRVAALKPDSTARLDVERAGRALALNVRVGTRPLPNARRR